MITAFSKLPNLFVIAPSRAIGRVLRLLPGALGTLLNRLKNFFLTLLQSSARFYNNHSVVSLFA